MSWFSDIFDYVGDAVSTGWDWVKENKGDIQDGLNFGRKAYNLFDVNNARQGSRKDILNFLRQQEQSDNDYARQMWEYQNAQRSAAAANARAMDAARRKASNKAFKQQSKMLNELMKQYQPYNDAVQALTPKMAQNYGQFLDTTSLLNQYLTPKVMGTLGSAPKASFEQAVPKSAYAVAFPQSAPISFPTPDETLKKR